MSELVIDKILCPHCHTETRSFPVYTDNTETEIAFYALDWECPKCKKQVIEIGVRHE